jgi:hypothetical protein
MSDVIGAKIPPDLREQIDATKQPDESDSEALRRLVRKGLDDTPRADPSIIWWLSLTFTVMFFTAYRIDGNRGAAAVGLVFMQAVATWAAIPDLRDRVNHILTDTGNQ